MQVWSESINWFTRYCVGKTNFNSFYGLVTLKIRSRSPKSNQLCASSQQCSCASLVKIHSLFRRYRVGKPNLICFHGLVTLKMRSMSPKSNQLFPPSQPCIYASLIKIHPLVQKISRRKEATRTRTPTGSAPKNNRSPTFGWGDIISRVKITPPTKFYMEVALS